jgi:hypothetical protein
MFARQAGRKGRLPSIYNAMSRLLTITAAIEAGTGLGLLIVPAVVVWLLLAAPLETVAATTLGRVGGAGLLTLGVACWIARRDTQSRAGRGLVAAMVLYNVGAVLILALAGIASQPVGVFLWPAVLLHIAMTVWCVVELR